MEELSPVLGSLVVLGFANLSILSAPVSAQCGYGTSEQDCMHQQQAQSARDVEEINRQQFQQQQQQQQQQQTPQAPPPPRQFWVNSYLSVVHHAEANDVWAVWDDRVSYENADRSALAMCTQMMGDGCKVAGNGRGGTIAIARDQSGYLWWQWGDQPHDATSGVKASCSKSGGKCSVFRSVTAKPWLESESGQRQDRTQFYRPTNIASVLKTHAMIAWPTKVVDQKWQRKTWLISGTKGYENTKKKLLDQCKLDTRVPCKIGQEISDGYLVQYQTESGRIYWTAEQSQSEGAARVKEQCLAMNTKCKVLSNFDTAISRLSTIDESASTTRTYLAVAWPQNAAPKWNNVAVVTGFPTLAGAKAKAIEHCEKESGVKCKIIGEVDQGYRTLLGLYTDENHTLRYYQDETRGGIAQMVKEDCVAAKTTCRELKIFEAREYNVSTLSRQK